MLDRIGGAGHWVSIVQRPESSMLYLRWWSRARANYEWTSLKHDDLDLARQAAREAAAGLLQATKVAAGATPLLSYVFARYEKEMTPTKGKKQRGEDKRRIAMWTTFLGSDFDPMELTKSDLKRFEAARREGTVVVPGRKLEAVRNRAIQADEAFLNAVFTWASGIEAGTRILAYNPMANYEKPRELNPRRPRTSYDVFLQVDAVADHVDPQKLFRGFHSLLESLGW
ncbi:MAG: hypothetical protein AB7G12_17520, partial [Thermoanaerobaculia bacterium]